MVGMLWLYASEALLNECCGYMLVRHPSMAVILWLFAKQTALSGCCVVDSNS